MKKFTAAFLAMFYPAFLGFILGITAWVMIIMGVVALAAEVFG